MAFRLSSYMPSTTALTYNFELRFLSAATDYNVFAFIDFNNNDNPDFGEPSAQFGQTKAFGNIRISADHLLNLINDILDLSRIEAGRFEVRLGQVDLRQLASECAVGVAPLLNAGVELRQLLEPVPSLRTDADRLRRVLTNLLGNAAKFTEQGTITLSVRPADQGIEVVVADTGVGIPAEELPYIFDEFRQVARKGSTAQEGTGLGLAIVEKYVGLLGGRIAVESTVGQGTRFIVRLRDYPEAKAS
jgi:signal transduction histidine kinase